MFNIDILNEIATGLGLPGGYVRKPEALSAIAGELIGSPQSFQYNIDAYNAIAGHYIGSPQSFRLNIDAVNAIVADITGEASSETSMIDALTAWRDSTPTHTLEFLTQPDDATDGEPFGQQPVVRALDLLGDLDTDFTGDVTISIYSGDGTLSGTVTKAAVAGVATFTDLEIALT